MGRVFRVIETRDETWRCHWGDVDYDEHLTLSAAVEHIRLLAAAQGPATLFAHWLDGSVTDVSQL